MSFDTSIPIFDGMWASAVNEGEFNDDHLADFEGLASTTDSLGGAVNSI